MTIQPNNRMPLDLTDVSLFARVCATRNLSAAGREFGLSPAASSARLAQLERKLGARLLHRTTRQITLTQDGEAFLQEALTLLQAAEQAAASVGRASQRPEGLLRVAASASFGRQHLAPAIAPFLRQFPGIRLDLRLSDHVIDMTEHGIDVAVRIGALKDSALIAKKLAPNRVVLCATPAYLAAHGTPRTPQDLLQHECLALNGLSPWRFRNDAGDTITVRIGGRLSSDNGEVLRDAALDGLGISMQSTWSVAEHLKSGRLVAVLKDFPPATEIAVWAVYLNRNFLPPRTQAFIDYFSERFGPAPYWDAGLDL